MRAIALTASLLIVARAMAQEGATTPPKAPDTGSEPRRSSTTENITPGVTQRPEPRTVWQKWSNFVWDEIERIDRMDLYGVTAQLPKGYLKLKWDITMLKASKRYNDRHVLTPAVPPIEFTENGTKLLSLDLGLEGKGGGHTIQVSYGILGNLDWYIELPFQYMDVSFNPRFLPIDDQGDKMDKSLLGMFGLADPKTFNDKEALCRLLTAVGRPVPGMRYKGKWLLGDVNTGFSWNWFRNRYISAALTPRVFFPTGRIADADNSLLYGTGPELDVGRGGWAIGFTQGYDVRIFKYSYWVDIIASTEFTTAYGFEQKRSYPTSFIEPAAFVAALDPSGMNFPDLSCGPKGSCIKKKKTFSYTPGFSLDWTTQLQVQIAILGLGFGYGVSHSQEPEIDGDQGFINMVKSLQLMGQSTTQAIQLSAALTLLPLYIPAQVGFQWRKVVDGYNALVYDDYYQVTINTYFPLFPRKATPFPSQAFPEWEAREKAAESSK